jgi:hypothetical protein
MSALEGHAAYALRLCAAADKLRHDIGDPSPPADQDRLGRVLDIARETLSQTEADSMMAEGRALSLEQALDYAFQAPD